METSWFRRINPLITRNYHTKDCQSQNQLELFRHFRPYVFTRILIQTLFLSTAYSQFYSLGPWIIVSKIEHNLNDSTELTVYLFNEVIKKINSISKGSSNNKLIEMYIDNSEFIQLFKICQRTARYWRKQKKIPFTRFAGRIYYHRDEIYKLFNEIR